jgi:hypothetical protein
MAGLCPSLTIDVATLAPRSTFESRCINEDPPDFSFNAAEQEEYFTFRGDCWAAGATLPEKSL